MTDTLSKQKFRCRGGCAQIRPKEYKIKKIYYKVYA